MDVSDIVGWTVSRDLQAFACILVELLMSKRTRFVSESLSLLERFKACRTVCLQHFSEVPR